MLSIFERIKLPDCGSLSTVASPEDDVPYAKGLSDSSYSTAQDTPTSSDGISKKSTSSFGSCTSPNFHSKYHPHVEPLSPDALIHSLSPTVYNLLECISASPPKGGDRKAVREFNTQRTAALQKLHDLTQKGQEHNRVPLVCNDEGWDAVGVLSDALLASTEECSGARNSVNKGKKSVDEDRRLICWTLNNLSVPYENKMAMQSANLLHALTKVIQNNLPESYLCCICLLNLTYLADAIRPVAFYVPSSYDKGKAAYSTSRSRSNSSRNSGGRPPISPSRTRSLNNRQRSLNSVNEGEGRLSEISGLVLGSSTSLVRILEKMMLANAPFLKNTKQSVQGEALRWSCGLIRNITYAGDAAKTENGNQVSDSLSGTSGRQGSIPKESIEEICILLSQTEIPRLMVQIMKDSERPTVKWTKDSIEDICMGAFCNMAQWQSSQEALKRAGALECLEKIEKLPGIHGYRARAIRCSLGALPKHFG